LQGRRRKDGLTVFLDLATLEPYEDQWAFLPCELPSAGALALQRFVHA
jgi:hypothetical protein